MQRRELIGLGFGFGAAAVAGAATGYRYHSQLRQWSLEVQGKPPAETGPVSEFGARASKITDQQRRQTKETVLALRTKYQGEVLGRFRVWDLLQKLALCVDPTDTSLQCTSQYMHVCQVIAGLEQDGELDDDMLLTALLHDLGKVALLSGEAPEHVVCFTEPVEAREPGAGLEHALFQFGHDEIAYSRFKDYVPEHVAWTLRYHSMILGKAEAYMSPRDLEKEQKYLSRFRKYDQGTKSTAFLPAKATLDRYRDFVERRFPDPILF